MAQTIKNKRMFWEDNGKEVSENALTMLDRKVFLFDPHGALVDIPDAIVTQHYRGVVFRTPQGRIALADWATKGYLHEEADVPFKFPWVLFNDVATDYQKAVLKDYWDNSPRNKNGQRLKSPPQDICPADILARRKATAKEKTIMGEYQSSVPKPQGESNGATATKRAK